jgi:hypothetical protein
MGSNIPYTVLLLMGSGEKQVSSKKLICSQPISENHFKHRYGTRFQANKNTILTEGSIPVSDIKLFMFPP